MSGSWGDLLNPTSVVGILVIGGILIYLWRKDAQNPAQAASNSVISASVEYSGSVFQVATSAMNMAQEALDSNQRCEKRVTGLIRYNRTLQNQVVALGGVPADPPPGLMDE